MKLNFFLSINKILIFNFFPLKFYIYNFSVLLFMNLKFINYFTIFLLKFINGWNIYFFFQREFYINWKFILLALCYLPFINQEANMESRKKKICVGRQTTKVVWADKAKQFRTFKGPFILIVSFYLFFHLSFVDDLERNMNMNIIFKCRCLHELM